MKSSTPTFWFLLIALVTIALGLYLHASGNRPGGALLLIAIGLFMFALALKPLNEPQPVIRRKKGQPGPLTEAIASRVGGIVAQAEKDF